MAKLVIKGDEFIVPPLSLGVLEKHSETIKALDLFIPTLFSKSEDGEPVKAPNIQELIDHGVKMADLIEEATKTTDKPLKASYIKDKATSADIINILALYYPMMFESGFEPKSGEATAAADSTQI